MQPQDNNQNIAQPNPEPSSQVPQSPPINPLQNPAYNPGPEPTNQPSTQTNGAIDYNDPSSPPPPIVVSVEDQYANIPNQPTPMQPQVQPQASQPINGEVNWDDPKPNAGDHHAKGLFITGMVIVVSIIVGLGVFLTISSMSKKKQVSSAPTTAAAKTTSKTTTAKKTTPTPSTANAPAVASQVSTTANPIDPEIPATVSEGTPINNSLEINPVDVNDVPDFEDNP